MYMLWYFDSEAKSRYLTKTAHFDGFKLLNLTCLLPNHNMRAGNGKRNNVKKTHPYAYFGTW